MEQDTTITASSVATLDDQAATVATVETVETVEEELLVEEISIDGMCGVY